MCVLVCICSCVCVYVSANVCVPKATSGHQPFSHLDWGTVSCFLMCIQEGIWEVSYLPPIHARSAGITDVSYGIQLHLGLVSSCSYASLASALPCEPFPSSNYMCLWDTVWCFHTWTHYAVVWWSSLTRLPLQTHNFFLFGTINLFFSFSRWGFFM